MSVYVFCRLPRMSGWTIMLVSVPQSTRTSTLILWWELLMEFETDRLWNKHVENIYPAPIIYHTFNIYKRQTQLFIIIKKWVSFFWPKCNLYLLVCKVNEPQRGSCKLSKWPNVVYSLIYEKLNSFFLTLRLIRWNRVSSVRDHIRSWKTCFLWTNNGISLT